MRKTTRSTTSKFNEYLIHFLSWPFNDLKYKMAVNFEDLSLRVVSCVRKLSSSCMLN